MKQNGKKEKANPAHSHREEQRADMKNEINMENTGAGIPHNSRKEPLGPNTRR